MRRVAIFTQSNRQFFKKKIQIIFGWNKLGGFFFAEFIARKILRLM